MRPYFVFVSTLFLFLTAALSASEKQDVFANLARQAAAKSEIREKNFRLSAQIELFNGTAKPTLGSYSVIWLGSSRWRHEVHFPNYEEIRVVDGSRAWTWKSRDFTPLRVQQAINLFRPVNAEADGKFKVKEVKSEMLDGEKNKCFTLDYGHRLSGVCFEEKTGMYTRYLSPAGRVTYRDYAPFRDKLYARIFQLFDQEDLMVQLKVAEITEFSGSEQAILVPPVGAEPEDRCERLQSPRLTDGDFADFDRIAFKYLKAGARADLIFGAVVSTNGELEKLHVLQTGGKELDAAIAETMRKWKFKPALCESTPVPAEIQIRLPIAHAALPGSDCFGIGCNYRSPRHTPVYIVATGTVLYTP